MLTFDKSEFLAAVRQVLGGIAAWNNYLFDDSAAERLLELEKGTAPDPGDLDEAVDWARPGCLGPRLENAQVLRHLSTVYDFVTTGEWNGDQTELDEARHELTTLDPALHSNAVLDSPSGHPLIPEPARYKVREVLEHLMARCQLYEGQLLELRQVALLAGLAEKTVRMAAMRTGEGPELNTVRRDNRTWVEASEALRWLSTKRNFRPTRFRGRDAALAAEPKDLPQLQWTLRTLRERAGLSTDDLGRRLDWGPDAVASYARLESGSRDFDVTHLSPVQLLALAKALDVDNAKAFVRAAGRILADYTIDRALANAELN